MTPKTKTKKKEYRCSPDPRWRFLCQNPDCKQLFAWGKLWRVSPLFQFVLALFCWRPFLIFRSGHFFKSKSPFFPTRKRPTRLPGPRALLEDSYPKNFVLIHITFSQFNLLKNQVKNGFDSRSGVVGGSILDQGPSVPP